MGKGLRMVRISVVTLVLGGLVVQNGCDLKPTPQYVAEQAAGDRDKQEEGAMGKIEKAGKVVKAEAEWRKALTAEQYRILRQKGTERAFSGEYDEFFEEGTYLCAGCGQELFGSDAKYNSGCGWPAFSQPADKEGVEYSRDSGHGMTRTEVTCSRCGGHLGHVFDDGPQPGGLRYCINSAALNFKKAKE